MNKTLLTIRIIFLLIGASCVSSTDNNTKMLSNKNQPILSTIFRKIPHAGNIIKYFYKIPF